jgi:hypothetical protein
VTLREMGIFDSVGLPNFQQKQLRAIVALVKREKRLECPPPPCEGRGVVISGGGRYLSHAWVAVQNLRAKGCQLPVQIWHLGAKEMPSWAKLMFAKLDAETVDIYETMKRHPYRQMSGWLSKNFAIRHCPFKEVIFTDADSFVSDDPEKLMDDPQVRPLGALFFSDVGRHAKNDWAWIDCGLLPPEKEGEGGQYYVNKEIGWLGLQWALWMGEHSRVFFSIIHGDKDLTPIGFRVSGVPIEVSLECEWAGWGIRQSWKGKEWFRHCMGAKRGETEYPKDIAPLFKEWQANTMGKA